MQGFGIRRELAGWRSCCYKMCTRLIGCFVSICSGSTGSRGQAMEATVAVADKLPMSVLLGTDTPLLSKLLSGELQKTRPMHKIDNALVVTRVGVRKQLEEELEAGDVLLDIQPKALETLPEDGMAVGPDAKPTPEKEAPADQMMSLDPEWSFDDEIFVGGREKAKLTKGQKRRNNAQRTAKPSEVRSCDNVLHINRDTLKTLQDTDNSLKDVREAADLHPADKGVGFYGKEGLLYRWWGPTKGKDGPPIEQLVLPSQCRNTVLQLAHDIPLAGHLGKEKTSQRILERFYWPTLYRDVANFCKGCGCCQKASHYKGKRAPLVPLPIIDVPFKRIAMDIIGPLPHSRSGNKYIPVVCDYATRYPEAMAICSIEAERIAEELVKLFARVGIPEEILTDQGSNFTSSLLAELYRMLHVHPIRMSPYHPQTDGLVERFNQTLKSML